MATILFSIFATRMITCAEVTLPVPIFSARLLDQQRVRRKRRADQP